MTAKISVRIYSFGVATLAAALAAALVADGYGLGGTWTVLGLAAVAALTERMRIRLTSTAEESISLIPTLFAALLYGPVAAMTVAAASLLPDVVFPPRGVPSPRLRWATYTGFRVITGASAALVAETVAGGPHNGLGRIAAATAAAAVVAQVLDGAFAALTLWVRRRAALKELLQCLMPLVMTSIPLYTPIVAFLVYAYKEFSSVTLPLFFVPALAAQRLFVLYQEQRRLVSDLGSAKEKLERAHLSFASALVATLDARDRYTAGHSAAVAVYARDIARRLDLSRDDQERAHLAGLVHDIGKIGLPAGLLEKTGALTLEERRSMEQHPVIGERILARVETYADIAAVVRHHHERIDGHGYPDGLTGQEIPLLARIISVADAYNAMTSDRPYRDAMPSRVARLRLAQAVGSQFDTAVVAAFEAILATASPEYCTGQDPSFRMFGNGQDGLDGASLEPPPAVAHIESRRVAGVVAHSVGVGTA